MARSRDPDLFGETSGFDKSADTEAEDVTLTLVIHGDVGASTKVSETGDEHRAVLLPRSQITVAATGKRTSEVGKPKYAIAEVTMPEWLAKDRGLI